MKIKGRTGRSKNPTWQASNHQDLPYGYKLRRRAVARIDAKKHKVQPRPEWPATPRGKMALRVAAATLVAGLFAGLLALIERLGRRK